jgi:tetratricopeptide (TPR) repeat protein
LRGQNDADSGEDARAIQEFQQALAIDSISSLASYRLGDVYFQQKNYQAAADSYRAAMRGDDEPKWTEVWADLQLGKVFDASGQRERALNQYREAIQTGDNTGGALDLARAYLQEPYKSPGK